MRYLDRRGTFVYDLSRKGDKTMTISADLLRGYTDTIIMQDTMLAGCAFQRPKMLQMLSVGSTGLDGRNKKIGKF